MSSTPRPALHEEDFLTTREAASLLGVALRTVQLWVEAGKLSAWKTRGGHRRIPRQAVESLRQQRDVSGTIEPSAEQRTASAAAQPLHVLVPHEVAERGVLRPDAPSFATLKELIMQRMSARD